MEISVVICTHNRRDYLRMTLESLERRVQARDWELLLIDNGSTDATADLASEFERRLPLRYFHEPRLGKSFALNRAGAEAAGDLLLYTDDDVEIQDGWMEAYRLAARNHPEAGFFGGRVWPLWERKPPRWVEENLPWLFMNPHVDWGDEELWILPGASPGFAGANMAIRREVLAKGIRFPEHLGVAGKEMVRGEEIVLQAELLREGTRGLYVPNAVVRHRHPPERMTETYLRRFYFGEGMGRARCEQFEGPKWLGIPRFLWRELAGGALRYAVTRPFSRSKTWLKAEIRMARAAGSIWELQSGRKKPEMPA
jgi:glycosyltransferase involved in cell wall biosynthesis